MTSVAFAPRDAAWIADDVEARAFADLYRAAPEDVRAKLGLEVRAMSGAILLIAPGFPTPLFNRTIGLGMSSRTSMNHVRKIEDFYRKAGSAGWWLHWNPFATPEDMPARLLDWGFTAPMRRSWAKMLRPPVAAPVIDSGLRIGPARIEQVRDVVASIVQSFEMPPFMQEWLEQLHRRPRWTLYAAVDDGAVVGGGCLFLDGDSAWLGMGSVLAAQRRRGGQGALMARRIADAIARGATKIATETGEPIADEPNPSLDNMARCGFVRVASRLNFVAPA
jgi:hypothetical protein